MTLTRGEKAMCGVALVVVLLCLAVIGINCSADGVGTISVRIDKSAGKIVQPSAHATPGARAKTDRLGKPARRSQDLRSKALFRKRTEPQRLSRSSHR